MGERQPVVSEPRSSTGAVIAIVALALIGIAAAAFLLRGAGSGVEGLSRKVGDFVTELKEAHESPGPADQPAPVAETPAVPTDGTVGMEVPANPTQAPGERPRAVTQLQRIRDTVSECMPTLMQFAQNVRLIAADITPDNVDLVQESASVPGRFVRMSCDWDGKSAYNISDNGRMVVPPKVGDTSDLPPELLPTDYLDGDWLVARVAAAARSALPPRSDAVRRIELSFVQGQGVLVRVHFDGKPQRTVVVGPELRIMPASQFFPQVERFADIKPESAQLGYRDQGQVIWSQGVSEMLDRLPRDYFDKRQRFFAIAFVGRRADAWLPASGSAPVSHVVIDEYGDAQEPERAQRASGYCDRPFTWQDARTALDRAIKARGEPLEAFEQIDFGSAEIDCSENAKAPGWRFGNG